jgi:CRISPR-associated protein Cmr3
VKIVKFEIIEALRFAAGHTGGVEVYSKELVHALPLPSTVLGALGAALGVQLDKSVCEKPFDDLKSLAEKLGYKAVDLFAESSEEPLLWGPLIEAGGRYYFARENDLIDVNRRRNYVSKALEYVLRKHASTTLENEVFEADHRLKPSTRFGLKLSEGRVAEPGYAYRANFYGYDLKPYPASLLYIANIVARSMEELVRLGGEGRVAGLSLLDSDQSKDLLDLFLGRGDYAIALSPVLFYAEGEAIPGSTQGLREVEDVIGIPSSRAVKLRTVTVGLGFSEVCKQRRPLLQALPPGTLLKPKSSSAKAVGLLSCLGYGSLLRVDAHF